MEPECAVDDDQLVCCKQQALDSIQGAAHPDGLPDTTLHSLQHLFLLSFFDGRMPGRQGTVRGDPLIAFGDQGFDTCD